MKRLYQFLILTFLVLCPVLTHAQAPGVIPDIYGKTYGDNAGVRWGNMSDFICSYLTVDTPDTMVCGTSLDSNAILFVEKADMGFDFAHAAQTDPTLFVHSHNQSTNQWISISHNGTNGVVDVGTGKVTFPDGIDNTVIGATTKAAGGFTTLTATGAASAASLTVTGSLLSTSTTDIGWSVVSGANTACNTTCTNGCVFGQNTADMSIVDCAAATADVCICAGAN